MNGDFELLTADHVTKRFGDLTAVNDASLRIAPGEIFALLGANGAGKTTLIGCICGLVHAFDGEIRVAGHDVRADYRITRQLIGLVPQELNFDGFFTVLDVLRYQGGYFGRRDVEDRARHLLEAFGLADKATVNTRKLSGGMKRRLMICKALMHEPVLLFLDEPTAGVDVDLREELWQYIRNLRQAGTTVVLTTHYLEEAERMADRIGILNRGRLVRVEPREALMQHFGRRWLEARFSESPPEGIFERLSAFNPTRTGKKRIRIEFPDAIAESGNGDNPLHFLQEAARAENLVIESLEGGRSRLEDIFREVLQNDRKHSV